MTTTHRPSGDLDTISINTIRTLAIDAVEQANSGHPGTPMGMAPVGYQLWQYELNFDPADPLWPNRDRFVLSAGHASMLLYSLLHLAGVKAVNPAYETLGHASVTLEDIKTFRELGSRCPGHPEYRWTSGVETTTGPLGQGVANSVGMAISSAWLASRYNKPGFNLFDYKVYSLMGDGDMMEGISDEAASLAGHLGLSNLCWIYDNNKVTIEGPTALAFSEDVSSLFLGYGWNVTKVSDANDLSMLAKAFQVFRDETQRPTLIIVDSHIGFGAPDVQDTSAAHGAPLGAEEAKKAKHSYGWPENAKFLIPEGVYEHFAKGIGARGGELRAAWISLFADYERKHPTLAAEILAMQHRELPLHWDVDIPTFNSDPKGMATRESSGEVLNAIAPRVPWLLGGSADLTPSTLTHLTFAGAGDFEAADYNGRNLHFGIREHGAAAISSGLSLSKVRPYWSTFLVFSDYARGAIRLSALMEIPVIHIFTHDSIGMGQDGPTHQPIEQLASLRAIPGLIVLRPADANEVAEAWRVIMELQHNPVALVLTRQAVPTLDRSRYGSAKGVARGAYVLADPINGPPEAIVIATGSEVSLAIAAYEELSSQGIAVRVVSMPSCELFDRQPATYRDSVLPPEILARVAVEEASTFGWHRYVGIDGAVVGMHTFGASAPLKDLQNKFGFTPEKVADTIRQQLQTQLQNQRKNR
ncbi:transketolase [Acidithrix ferrooxidans]|uniref:Transketolase n=1 Tax=Acidithrix ferrooxidans TaxID=1280514 RepID=A0A0D8HFN7_9ACTN|nr:transketolase [Acidithrix ferrooxidans]KJF15846.1 transketolase [Acidithrix ferrooxidans]